MSQGPSDGHAESASTPPEPPRTGDIVVDAALEELAAADPGDLDAQLSSGERVQRTLQGRLSDLGG
ncbi:conserved hypothetical protein [Nostocoides japonicum T1-X7]|uniref:Uncharacterized protein n=1 Tax=Nostocoides japonicum T1-X7 TaxID=1194083 RepID=A0A077M1P2_9MICO|nr:hypothetical protein [Tetrasphaera japonica]CCH78114.1 conserved hypothetical protein [Tetrasphaera japonica T1-X7]